MCITKFTILQLLLWPAEEYHHWLGLKNIIVQLNLLDPSWNTFRLLVTQTLYKIEQRKHSRDENIVAVSQFLKSIHPAMG